MPNQLLKKQQPEPADLQRRIASSPEEELIGALLMCSPSGATRAGRNRAVPGELWVQCDVTTYDHQLQVEIIPCVYAVRVIDLSEEAPASVVWSWPQYNEQGKLIRRPKDEPSSDQVDLAGEGSRTRP